jgi:nucleoside-diphosphate-sugar epimerase
MNVLVTGGSGFIGKKLVAFLISQSCKVSVVSRQETVFNKDVRLIKMDLLTGSFSFLENEYFDVVINCAADLKNNEVMEELHVNVPMRMLKFLKGRSCRWV